MAVDDDSDRVLQNRQWLLIAGVAAAIVAALVIWYFVALRPNYVALYSGLRPAQAAAIVAVLEEEGASYRLGAGGSEILVRARDADQMRLTLESSHAPTGGIEGFELFNESDMGLTDFAQKHRYQRALQGEIARTIMMMQGVVDVRVHVSMPERTLFRSERRAAEAAVTLIMQPGAEASAEAIEGIQRLVAAAVNDLNTSDVVVIDASGRVLSARVSIEPLQSTAESAPAADYLVEVVRLALPQRRFDVRLEEIPSALEGGEETADGPRRLFTITTDSLLAPEEHEAVRQRFEEAGLLDGSSRTVLTYRVDRLPDAPAIEPAVPPREPAAAPASAPQRTGPIWQAIGGVVFLLLGGAILIMGWRRARRPTLSFDEHRRIAERLSTGLERRETQDA